jgi:choline dehydrogenase-like flavoprotein
MTIATALITPTSRELCLLDSTSASKMRNITGGSITLASANPFDAPNIDPAFLNSDFDIFTMREGVKAALRFVAGSAWQDYVIGPFGALADAKTDAQIDAYVRSEAVTVFHPFSTASMSPIGSSQGVVNPDLTVKNTVGLRIVDASVVVCRFRALGARLTPDVVHLSRTFWPPTLKQVSTRSRSELRN